MCEELLGADYYFPKSLLKYQQALQLLEVSLTGSLGS
jgi:hypothetical protein